MVLLAALLCAVLLSSPKFQAKATEVNLALGKPAYASSVYGKGLPRPLYPSNAVNGDTLSAPYLIFATGDGDSNRWISIYLEALSVIDHVVVYNRLDCCGERLTGAELRIGNTSIMSASDSPNLTRNKLVWTLSNSGVNGAVYDIYLPTPVAGRWVTLQTPGSHLNIMEVEVYGTIVREEVNLALGKPTYCSSVYGKDLPRPLYSSNAVNSDTSIVPYLIFATDDGDPYRWLSIDLGALSVINHVVVYNRPDCCGDRLTGAELRIGNTSITTVLDTAKIRQNSLVWTFSGCVNGAVYNIPLTTPLAARWVTLQTPGTHLNIMEVQVYGYYVQ